MLKSAKHFANKLKFPLVFRFASSIAGLGISWMISRSYGPDSLAVVSFSQRILQIFLIISAFGFREYVIKNFIEPENEIERSNQNNWINAVFSYSLLTCGGLFIVVLLFPENWLRRFIDIEGAQVFFKIFMAGLLLQLFARLVSFFLIARKDVTKGIILDGFVINAVTLAGMFIYTCSAAKVDYVVLSSIFVLGRVANFLISILEFRALKLPNLKPTFDFKLIERSNSFFWISVLYHMFLNIDLIIAGFFLDPADLGVYAAASLMASLMRLFTFVFNTKLTPELVHLDRKGDLINIKNALKSHVRVAVAIGVGFIAGVTIFGEVIMEFWGKEFAGGTLILSLISIAVAIQFSLSPFQIFLKMLGHERLLFTILVFALILQVLLISFLTWEYGALGTSVGLGLSFLIFFGVETFVASRKIKEKELSL